jgi:hypothetical protein
LVVLVEMVLCDEVRWAEAWAEMVGEAVVTIGIFL